ncbi:unnamed protein product, partial [Dicrocoelium dendriticum]
EFINILGFMKSSSRTFSGAYLHNIRTDAPLRHVDKNQPLAYTIHDTYRSLLTNTKSQQIIKYVP